MQAGLPAGIGLALALLPAVAAAPAVPKGLWSGFPQQGCCSAGCTACKLPIGTAAVGSAVCWLPGATCSCTLIRGAVGMGVLPHVPMLAPGLNCGPPGTRISGADMLCPVGLAGLLLLLVMLLAGELQLPDVPACCGRCSAGSWLVPV